MNKIVTLIVMVLFGIQLYSQTKKEKKEIIKKSNVEYLNNLSNKLSFENKKEKERIVKLALKNNWTIKKENGLYKKELIGIIDGKPIYYSTQNIAAGISTRANTLHNNGLLGLNIEGQNMTAYVWDGGVARTSHNEYDGLGGNNRFTVMDGSSIGNHGAHVTGTIMAYGHNPSAKGMAPQCFVKGYDWNNDTSEVANQAANGMLLSNHSYGIYVIDPDTGTQNAPDWMMGCYNDTAATWDAITYNAPYYLPVLSAGNDGLSNYNGGLLNGYDKLTGNKNSKNPLIIANAQDASIDSNGNLISVNINNSSSQGPTDDLRIKPDIAGNGTDVFSSIGTSDSAYDVYSGTSMASPNVTGTLLLLQQYYNELNGNFMKAATLKGLALHTADDAGAQGPDAKFGWGLMNAKKAAETISSIGEESIIEEITLMPNQSYSTSITSDGINKLIASISWTDPAGNSNNGQLNNNTPVLVNDLDIRITKDGNTYFPYKLTSVTTNDKIDNNVDPYERIDIDSASGNYTITVTHKGNLTNGTQNFSLIVTGLEYSGECIANEPTNLNASLFLGDASFTWDNVIGAIYEVRYKESSETEWTTVTVSNESLNLTGLTGSQYNAQVRSICEDEGTQSNWVSFERIPFIVLNNNEYDYSQNVNIFTKNNEINIDSYNHSLIKQIKIYSFLGKLLYNGNLNSNKVSIPKNTLRNEKVVIIKVQLENGIVINKKIIL